MDSCSHFSLILMRAYSCQYLALLLKFDSLPYFDPDQGSVSHKLGNTYYYRRSRRTSFTSLFCSCGDHTFQVLLSYPAHSAVCSGCRKRGSRHINIIPLFTSDWHWSLKRMKCPYHRLINQFCLTLGWLNCCCSLLPHFLIINYFIRGSYDPVRVFSSTPKCVMK